jgi:hypothetical protein
VAWYARDGYFVGLKGNQIVIFRGQPGGLLWFHPTVAVTTSVTTSQVESYHLCRPGRRPNGTVIGRGP